MSTLTLPASAHVVKPFPVPITVGSAPVASAAFPRPVLLVGVLPKSGLKRPLAIAVALHIVLIGIGFLSRHDTLLDLINQGEIEAVAPSNAVPQPPIEIIDLVPPPPPVANPEFVIPKEVPKVVEVPKPEEPKPKPVAAPQQAPAFAAQSLVVGDKNFPKPPYPSVAKLKHYEGTVTLQLSVSEGQIVDVQVSQSSGYAILDATAATWIRQRWHFPATVTRSLTQPIAFQLADG